MSALDDLSMRGQFDPEIEQHDLFEVAKAMHEGRTIQHIEWDWILKKQIGDANAQPLIDFADGGLAEHCTVPFPPTNSISWPPNSISRWERVIRNWCSWRNLEYAQSTVASPQGHTSTFVITRPAPAPMNASTATSWLSHASIHGWCSDIEWLLSRGGDVHSGRLLRDAAKHDQHDAVTVLLDAGARDSPDPTYGRNALHAAIKFGALHSCRALLSRGASLAVRDRYGITFDTYARAARREGHETIATLIANVIAAGSWHTYVAAPRAKALTLRRELVWLQERGRVAPSGVPVHERLFLQTDIPEEIFSHVFTFWDSGRDYIPNRREQRTGRQAADGASN